MVLPSGDHAGEVELTVPDPMGPGRSASLREAVPSELATYSVLLFVKIKFWPSGDHAPLVPCRSAKRAGEPPRVGKAHIGVDAALNAFNSPTSSLDPSGDMLQTPKGVPSRVPLIGAR